MSRISSIMAMVLALTFTHVEAKDIVLLPDESRSVDFWVTRDGTVVSDKDVPSAGLPQARQVIAEVMHSVLEELDSLKYVVMMPWSDDVADPVRLKDGMDIKHQWQRVLDEANIVKSGTSIGNIMKTMADGPECQSLIVLTDGIPAGYYPRNLPQIFEAVLAKKPVTVFIMDSTKVSQALVWYQKLSQASNYRVMLLSKENVLGVIPKMLEETEECPMF